MKIGIIGATGMAGSAFVIEGYQRRHQVTAITRSAGKVTRMFGNEIPSFERQNFELTREDLTQFDVIIVASNFTRASDHVRFAEYLHDQLAGTDAPIVVFIVGSSTLQMPDGSVMADRLGLMRGQAPWIEAAIEQANEYKYLQTVDDFAWMAISPQQAFMPGPATPTYLKLDDALIFNAREESRVTTGTLAKALYDELEAPTHIHGRFTAADKF
ncbi:MAG: NADH-flavin reductase [Weissella confusa]